MVITRKYGRPKPALRQLDQKTLPNFKHYLKYILAFNAVVSCDAKSETGPYLRQFLEKKIFGKVTAKFTLHTILSVEKKSILRHQGTGLSGDLK